MAAPTRRVVFGRINRRTPDGEAVVGDKFITEISRMFWQGHRPIMYTERRTGGRPRRRWVAADIEHTGRFLTGRLWVSGAAAIHFR
jgi:hypothetical protein